jgi:hypothetical protein
MNAKACGRVTMLFVLAACGGCSQKKLVSRTNVEFLPSPDRQLVAGVRDQDYKSGWTWGRSTPTVRRRETVIFMTRNGSTYSEGTGAAPNSEQLVLVSNCAAESFALKWTGTRTLQVINKTSSSLPKRDITVEYVVSK